MRPLLSFAFLNNKGVEQESHEVSHVHWCSNQLGFERLGHDQSKGHLMHSANDFPECWHLALHNIFCKIELPIFMQVVIR